MNSQTQLPTFTLAIYVGVLAGLVVLAVAFTMLRVYAYRHRLSTVTMSASYDANADSNNNALIATTLSALGSPLPDYPSEPPPTSRISVISSFGSSRWQQVKNLVADIRDRGLAAWSSLCKRLATRRVGKRAASKPDYRISEVDVEIATPCNSNGKTPVTPGPSYASQLSSKFQLSLFQSPASNSIGMI
ncbi:hypothetical protein L916_01468 [Phytophthora nicotianae]|uniref:Uncharacterized protein n=1 Tax=Phytophthora nicotianae TaxID=4792 RepID=W2JRI9_PHYNI|nr:hypothetical protein L916_01468 [Phytophthora nicotianae]